MIGIGGEAKGEEAIWVPSTPVLSRLLLPPRSNRLDQPDLRTEIYLGLEFNSPGHRRGLIAPEIRSPGRIPRAVNVSATCHNA
jgi:hypothetical protein